MTTLEPSTHSLVTSTPELQPTLLRRLRSVAFRLRLYVLVEGLCWVAFFLLAAAFLQFLLDYGTYGLRWSMRAALLAVIVLIAATILWRRLLSPLSVPIDAADVANLLERKFPSLSSHLISAVRFSRGETGDALSNSPALMANVINSADRSVSGLNFKEVLDSKRARWALLGLIVVGLIVASTLIRAPETTGLWFKRNVLLSNTPWPKRTHIIVDSVDGELIAPRGDDLVIHASAEGESPGEVELFYETESGQRGRQSMVTVGAAGSFRYRYTMKNAQEAFSFHLEGGDDRTDVYNVRLVDRPKIEHSRIVVEPPAYTRLDSFTLGDGERAAELLPGSHVRINIETNKPVESATLMAGPQAIADAHPGGAGYLVDFVPNVTYTYQFHLLDEFGFDNKEPLRFALRITKDDAPLVRLKAPGVGEMVTPQAILPLEVEFADTYGLANVELVHRVTHEDEREDVITFPEFEPYAKSFSTSLSWPIADTVAVPGDQVVVFARAADFDDVSGPNVADSPEVTLRVVTADELLAELGRREQEFRMDFERLIDAQERLRSELLTLMGPVAPDASTSEFAATAANLERRQRSIAQSVNVVRQQVEQVLQELRINQLSTQEVETRLGSQIAEPLTELSRRDFPLAADLVRQWPRDASKETAARVDQVQVALLSQMRAVLANMIQWQGYQEAITMLRDILRLQNELRTETQKTIEKNASDIFDN